MITVTYAQMVYLLATTWSSGSSCKDLVQNAKVYENGTMGCNYYKGYEVSCCPRAEHTPPSTTTTTPSIWAIVGLASALVGAACAFAKWKQKMNAKLAIPTIPTTVATTSSSGPIVTATAVPQSTNVSNNLPTIPTTTSPNIMTSSIPIVTEYSYAKSKEYHLSQSMLILTI
jgi:hypothetical protein